MPHDLFDSVFQEGAWWLLPVCVGIGILSYCICSQIFTRINKGECYL